jgi:hypothetical protein
VRPLAPIAIPNKPSIKDLQNIMENSARSMCIGSGGLTHSHLMADVGGPVEDFKGVLTECLTHILGDDCESSAFLATLARMTVLSMPDCPEKLRAILSTWPVFKEFTPKCFALMSQICNRGANMLRSGILQITTAVGLATGASASDVKKKTADYNGHCFNVGKITTSAPSGICGLNDAEDMGGTGTAGVKCFLLEGTASMTEERCLRDSVQVPVKLWHHPGQTAGFETRVLELGQYWTMLGQAVSSLTQVINSPNGGRLTGGGWPMQGPPVTGWVTSQIVCNSLDSDPSSYLEFYNRVMYTGWECIQEGRGCMPVEETHQGAGVSDEPGPIANTTNNSASGYVLGCHPYDLNNAALRAVNATVPQERYELMSAIMNEATPPLVDHSVLKKLSEYWAPCQALIDINTKAAARREPGVEYVRISCMETPCIPEFAPIICISKHVIAEDTNEINLARPDSDGVIVTCEPKQVGTGCHLHLDCPRGTRVPTVIHSLRTALKKRNWPGYIIVGDEG